MRPTRAARASSARRSAGRCALPASPVGRDVTAMVETRIADYVRHFERARAPPLRRLARPGRHFGQCAGDAEGARPDPRLRAHRASCRHVRRRAPLAPCSCASIVAADCAVRRQPPLAATGWRASSAAAPCQVGNGVDRDRFSPMPDASDAVLRARLGLPADVPVFLAVGGVEERKNTIRILEAFRDAPRRGIPSCRLVIAGGASLLDHDAYQARFAEALAQSGLPDGAVIRTGPLAAGADAGALSRRHHAGVPIHQGRLRPRGAGGDGERRAGRDLAHRAVHRISRRRRRRCGAIRSTRRRSPPPWRRRSMPRAPRAVASRAASRSRRAHDWTRTAQAHLAEL